MPVTLYGLSNGSVEVFDPATGSSFAGGTIDSDAFTFDAPATQKDYLLVVSQ